MDYCSTSSWSSCRFVHAAALDYGAVDDLREKKVGNNRILNDMPFTPSEFDDTHIETRNVFIGCFVAAYGASLMMCIISVGVGVFYSRELRIPRDSKDPALSASMTWLPWSVCCTLVL